MGYLQIDFVTASKKTQISANFLKAAITVTEEISEAAITHINRFS
jgi:hypothetical protein